MSEANTADDDKLWVWGTDAVRPRLLHSMIRIRDVDASLRFYRDGMGMTLLDRYDFEAYKFSILFLSFGGYDEGAAIELTYNWGVEEPYSHGSGYGHIALGVPDVAETVRTLEEHGGTVAREPYQLVPGGPAMAFVKDPDGYSIELIQTRRPEIAGV
jgi:lactoylglutathione lyase